MSGKLMSYVLETIISDETNKAAILSNTSSDNIECPRKQKKRSRAHHILFDDSDIDESSLNVIFDSEIESLDSDEQVFMKDFGKYVLQQVYVMKHLLPGRSVIDILRRIKEMELARFHSDSTATKKSRSELNRELELEAKF